MGENSSIEWTDHTVNFWVGCRKITAGCAHCYMFTDQTRYGQDPGVVRRTKTWGDPLKWNRKAKAEGIRKRVFTCSWSDFFIKEADPWRDEAWAIIDRCGWLDFQILTRRPERMAGRCGGSRTHLAMGEAFPGMLETETAPPRANVWLGVSVENRKQGLPRIDILRETPAAVRFLSIEPLLEDLGEIELDGIHWVIVGGESGPGARPMHPDWALSIRDQCLEAEVPFFFKQQGAWQVGSDHDLPSDRNRVLLLNGVTHPHEDLALMEGEWSNPQEHAVCISRVGKKAAGRELDGRTWEEMPCRD